MTVAVETEVQAQGREIVILRKQCERPRESEPQLVAIERHPLDLLKHLREVHGGMAHFGCNLRQCPASRGIAGEHELGPVREPLSPDTCARSMRRARPQGASGKCQCEALSVERLAGPVSQTMS